MNGFQSVSGEDKRSTKKVMQILICVKVKQQAFLGATIEAHRDGSWIHRCFSLNFSSSGRIIDLPSWAVLREREQYKWKASQTLESSPCVPVYWATNTPLGLRLALITPRRHRTTLFVSFYTTFHPHKLSLTALFLSFPEFCYLLPLPSVLLCRIQRSAAQSSLFSYSQALINFLKWWTFEHRLAMTVCLWTKATSRLDLRFNV